MRDGEEAARVRPDLKMVIRLLLLFGLMSLVSFRADGERLLVNDKLVPEGREDLLEIQNALTGVLEDARAATVCIEIGEGSGTGVIVSADGLVLTAGACERAGGEEGQAADGGRDGSWTR